MLEKGVNHAGFTCDEGDSARYDHVIKSYAKFWHATIGDTRCMKLAIKNGFNEV